jgi:hypothetical protein
MRRSCLIIAHSLLLLSAGLARAENAAPTAPAEPMVTVVTAMGNVASVTFQGDYGPSRIEGSLVALPEEPIKAREGKQVKEIPVRQLQEMQRTPLGVGPDATSTYQLSLFSGESFILQPKEAEPSGPQPVAVTRTMQTVSVPKAAVELKTELFGVVKIPFPRLLQITVQPIRGALHVAPNVLLPLQVLEGLTLSIPFPRVTNFRWDPLGGTATVSFGIAEGVTGRVKVMPPDAIVVRMADGEERRIPLSEVVQYNVEGPINVAANPSPGGGGSPGAAQQ